MSRLRTIKIVDTSDDRIVLQVRSVSKARAMSKTKTWIARNSIRGEGEIHDVKQVQENSVNGPAVFKFSVSI